MIKIAFFDIDGTLISFGKRIISETSLHALSQLQGRGVKVFVSTGRHICHCATLGFSFDGYVTLNGGVIYAGDEVIYRQPIDSQESAMIAELYQTSGTPCVAYFDGGIGINAVDDLVIDQLDKLGIALPQRVDLTETAKEGVYQYTPFINVQEADELQSRLKTTVITRWNPNFADINPADLSKAGGLARVLGHYGYQREECIAFGDGGNDVTMLKYAGIGVAMGNSADYVKECADYVTGHIDDDGLSAAMRHFGLL